MRRILMIVMIAVCVYCVTGCGRKEEIPESKFSRTIIDMNGDAVILPEKIEKVVSTSDPCTDMLVAFGLSNKLVGAYHRALESPWFSSFCPNADNIAAFNDYQPEVEALIELGTDIIFVPSGERAVALREKGICAITVRYYNPDEMRTADSLLGEIFGDEAKEKADEWLKEFDGTIEEISDLVKNIPEDEKPVAYEILADKGKGPFRTYYGDNQAWLSYAGGILATRDFADATSQAMPTEEAILAQNPDIIFIGGTYATKEYKDLLGNELWADIKAIKNKKIVIEPTGATAWNSCSTSYPLLVRFCFQAMYPERADYDLKVITHDFYQKFYGIDFCDEDIDLMFKSLSPLGTEVY